MLVLLTCCLSGGGGRGAFRLILALIQSASASQVEPCHYNPANRAANCSQYRFLPQGDEGNLQAAVASIGPISVAIDARQPKFAFYKSGGLQLLLLLRV